MCTSKIKENLENNFEREEEVRREPLRFTTLRFIKKKKKKNSATLITLRKLQRIGYGNSIT